MNEEQRRILAYLDAHAIGYANRKSSGEIRDECDLESGGVTNEHVRDLIKDMILNHNCCIGSYMWANGYWIIQNEEELEWAAGSLEGRANSIQQRANALRRNFINRNNG